MSAPAPAGEIMLFGVRVQVIDPMRKSVSMNNLSEYQPLLLNNNNPDTITTKAEDCAGAGGYASADDAMPLPSTGSRERKRGVPWTEDEHKQFLIGLHKVGKGDWRGISRNYVKTRTPTQVASHAQKYFLRRTNFNRRRRRSSLFDITTHSVTAMPTEEECREHAVKPPTMPSSQGPNINNGFSVVMPFPVLLSSMQGGNPMGNSVVGPSDHVRGSSPMLPVTTSSSSTMMMDFNLNPQIPTQHFPLSLSLSLSSTPLMPSFKNEDTLLMVV